MNEQQLKVVEHLQNNKNVLLIGQAGTGKSKLLEELKYHLPEKTVYITSTTGISALNIGAVTMHSFLGIKLGAGTAEFLYKEMYKNIKVRKRLLASNIVLCIDEDSMIPLVLFEKLNIAFQLLRKKSEPFGGIQMLLSGDFLQLEPINEELIYKSELITHFEKVILTHNYRQENDKQFQTLLDNLRFNKLTEEDLELLEEASKRENDGVKMFCLNRDIIKKNEYHLNSIKNKEFKFKAKYNGNVNLVNELKKQFASRGIDTIILKKDLKVMLTKNLNVEDGLVNGSLGIVTGFTSRGYPIVDFKKGNVISIDECAWELVSNNKTVATAVQIPLVLSYASSIHKCQGLTLDKVTVDLKNVFCNHQIYVALSRVRSLEGLALVNFDKDKIKVNRETIEFYNSIN